jgi:16S rRNA (guanine527-N7)-methyltransferase
MVTLEEGLLRLAEEPDIAALLRPRLEAVSGLLARYIDEIERFNPAYGLVSVKSREELVTRHILDSLAPLGIIHRLAVSKPDTSGQEDAGPDAGGPAIADLGSGAGLPGIPLAIVLPDFPVTLIERMGRRAGFLRNAAAVLGLENVTVEEVEMEKAAPARFKLLCFRAFRPLEPGLLKALFRLLVPGGFIAAYKGRLEAIRAELAWLQAGEPWECLPCPVPGLNEERRLVVLRGP